MRNAQEALSKPSEPISETLKRIEDGFWECSHDESGLKPLREELYGLIERVIAARDGEALRDGAYTLESSQLMAREFPVPTFEFILSVMKRPDFLGMEGFYHLLNIFDRDREKLSASQKERLIEAFEEAYPQFHDWMSCFTITEFAEELLNSEQGFQMFCNLSKVEGEMPRSFLPHAFEHLVTDAADEALSRRALARFMPFTSDPSERVRGEAAVSLRRIVVGGKNDFSGKALAALRKMKNDSSGEIREFVRASLDWLKEKGYGSIK